MCISKITLRGFTMIETLIVAAIGVSMLIILTILIFNFNKTSTYQQALIASSGSASTLMRSIGSLVLPASAVLQAHTFSSATYTSTSTALVLEIPSIDNSGNVIANTYDYAVFYASSTKAYRLLEANVLSSRVSETKLLSSTINTLIFTYNNTDFTQVHTITVDVRTQTYAKEDVLSDHRREQFRLRNF